MLAQLGWRVLFIYLFICLTGIKGHSLYIHSNILEAQVEADGHLSFFLSWRSFAALLLIAALILCFEGCPNGECSHHLTWQAVYTMITWSTADLRTQKFTLLFFLLLCASLCFLLFIFRLFDHLDGKTIPADVLFPPLAWWKVFSLLLHPADKLKIWLSLNGDGLRWPRVVLQEQYFCLNDFCPHFILGYLWAATFFKLFRSSIASVSFFLVNI